MASREATKEFNHFLVYFKDQSKLVVSRSKIHAEGRIKVGSSYPVQWGDKTQVEDAKILETGEWLTLSKLLNASKTDKKSEPKSKSKPKSKSVKPPPAKKRKTQEPNDTGYTANVILRVPVQSSFCVSKASDIELTDDESDISGLGNGSFLTQGDQTQGGGSSGELGESRALGGGSSGELGQTQALGGGSSGELGQTQALGGGSSGDLAQIQALGDGNGQTQALGDGSSGGLGQTQALGGGSSGELGQTQAPGGGSSGELGQTQATGGGSSGVLGQTQATGGGSSGELVRDQVIGGGSSGELGQNQVLGAGTSGELVQDQVLGDPGIPGDWLGMGLSFLDRLGDRLGEMDGQPTLLDLGSGQVVPMGGQVTTPAVPMTKTDGRINDSFTTSTPLKERKLNQLGQKLDVLNKRQLALEQSHKLIEQSNKRIENKLDMLINLLKKDSSVTSTVDSNAVCPSTDSCVSGENEFSNIPAEYRLDSCVLDRIKSQSNGPGNFAKNIVEKLFSELFTSDNARLGYSYFGGGAKNKLELDPERKCYVQQYVLHFFPDVRSTEVWKERVVPKINEALRRPTEKKKKTD